MTLWNSALAEFMATFIFMLRHGLLLNHSQRLFLLIRLLVIYLQNHLLFSLTDEIKLTSRWALVLLIFSLHCLMTMQQLPCLFLQRPQALIFSLSTNHLARQCLNVNIRMMVLQQFHSSTSNKRTQLPKQLLAM